MKVQEDHTTRNAGRKQRPCVNQNISDEDDEDDDDVDSAGSSPSRVLSAAGHINEHDLSTVEGWFQIQGQSLPVAHRTRRHMVAWSEIQYAVASSLKRLSHRGRDRRLNLIQKVPHMPPFLFLFLFLLLFLLSSLHDRLPFHVMFLCAARELKHEQQQAEKIQQCFLQAEAPKKKSGRLLIEMKWKECPPVASGAFHDSYLKLCSSVLCWKVSCVFCKVKTVYLKVQCVTFFHLAQNGRGKSLSFNLYK